MSTRCRGASANRSGRNLQHEERCRHILLGEVIVYKAPDGEVLAKYTERFLKDRGYEIRP